MSRDIQPIMIYLAGPIDDITINQARTWREEAGLDLPTGVVLFSPAHAYQGEVSEATAPKVDYINRVNIAFCDGMIANLSGPGRGFGTVREIEFARSRNKPVVVIDSIDHIVSMMAHDLHLVKNFDAALTSILQSIQEGRNPQVLMVPLPFLQPPEDQDE